MTERFMRPSPTDSDNPFAPTSFEHAKDRRSTIAKWSTLAVCICWPRRSS